MLRHKANPVRIIRQICNLTQAELAKVLDCARLTIVELESGKLPLSQRMAEKISLHTGVNKSWLLEDNSKTAPVCERDTLRAFTKEEFELRRAEVLAPRTGPGDIFMIQATVENFCQQLRACAAEAYANNEIIYFYYKARESLENWPQQWKSKDQAGLTEAQFRQKLESYSRAKPLSQPESSLT